MKQDLSVLQFVLYKKMNVKDLFEYNEHKFIEMDGINNKWYHELKHILKQMNNDSEHAKLSLYTHPYSFSQKELQYVISIDNGKDNKLNFRRTFTFQLNPKHPSFKDCVEKPKLRKIKDILSKKQLKLIMIKFQRIAWIFVKR